MKTATFRFYEELNDFLPLKLRKVSFQQQFPENATVKHVIEALGVPHVEVDLILVNQESVDFSYMIQEDDYVSVYPVFETMDISSVQSLRARPLRETRFILDTHLAKLAKYLRMLGFDTLFRCSLADREIVEIAQNEERIILTRDRAILKYKTVTHGYWIRSDKPADQLKEVIVRFDLSNQIKMFSRCLECNNIIEIIRKEDIDSRLEPLTRKYFFHFRRCPGCDRIYWKGSHYEKMKEFVEEILSS